MIMMIRFRSIARGLDKVSGVTTKARVSADRALHCGFNHLKFAVDPIREGVINTI